MDTVTIDGKTYLKTAKAADEVGYTADYVGQLCRKGTLDAMVLGKTWYVLETSLLAHKQAQSRINTAATRRDLQKQRQKEKNIIAQAQTGPTYPLTSHGERRMRLLKSDIRYTTDTNDLLPATSREASSHGRVPAQDMPKENTWLAKEASEGTVEDPVSEKSAGTSAGEALSQSEQEIADESEQESVQEEYQKEREDATEATAEEDDEQEREEMPVPIRKMASAGGLSVRRRRIWPKSPKMAPHLPKKEAYASAETSLQALKVRRSLLPAMCILGLILVFAVANILLQSTWVYTHSGAEKAGLETTYNLASVSSIIESVRRTQF